MKLLLLKLKWRLYLLWNKWKNRHQITLYKAFKIQNKDLQERDKLELIERTCKEAVKSILGALNPKGSFRLNIIKKEEGYIFEMEYDISKQYASKECRGSYAIKKR